MLCKWILNMKKKNWFQLASEKKLNLNEIEGHLDAIRYQIEEILCPGVNLTEPGSVQCWLDDQLEMQKAIDFLMQKEKEMSENDFSDYIDKIDGTNSAKYEWAREALAAGMIGDDPYAKHLRAELKKHIANAPIAMELEKEFENLVDKLD